MTTMASYQNLHTAVSSDYKFTTLWSNRGAQSSVLRRQPDRSLFLPHVCPPFRHKLASQPTPITAHRAPAAAVQQLVDSPKDESV